ncbi:PITH domain-containing protein [Hibiscus syriacus]|uniref:PITH domain-containing protein n=1 Tax=Hibiscus syriacus TaxID=106335 RepID=A0A6A2WQE8_HIBSY|nr:PITH domain-containing protein [Hibiscus syriacus]
MASYRILAFSALFLILPDWRYPLSYVCECDPGWKMSRDGYLFRFLACVIPNCTLDYSCQPAPRPVPQREVPRNSSFFDPCSWTYCGEGTCNRTDTYKHVCECRPGFSNLLNRTYFPCYSQCTLGSDCSRLGITVEDQQATPDGGKANTFLPGKLHWVAILVMSMAMALWK